MKSVNNTLNKINWKVRVKNIWFWVGLIALFFATTGVDVSTLTSWNALLYCLKDFISNPYKIGSVIVAFICYVMDPTTAGIGDSKQALSYSKPKK